MVRLPTLCSSARFPVDLKSRTPLAGCWPMAGHLSSPATLALRDSGTSLCGLATARGRARTEPPPLRASLAYCPLPGSAVKLDTDPLHPLQPEQPATDRGAGRTRLPPSKGEGRPRVFSVTRGTGSGGTSSSSADTHEDWGSFPSVLISAHFPGPSRTVPLSTVSVPASGL